MMKRKGKELPDHKLAMPDIHRFVVRIIERLHSRGFQAYVVGGAIRDLCLERPAIDWDVATSAEPEEVRSLFGDIRHFTIKHKTVTLVDSGHLYEVTTFRGGGNIIEDLGHRDFTINAMAYDIDGGRVIDPNRGINDLKRRLIRATGDPEERFREDPLRLLRAVRFASELGFRIESGTMEIIRKMSRRLSLSAQERVRDELLKILVTQKPSTGFKLMRSSGLLGTFLPELLEGYLKRQNPFHSYTVFRHVMETIDIVEADTVLRLAALLHDIAKPRVRKKINNEFRFYRHAEESALLAANIMERLRFSGDTAKAVTSLIALHMIDYSPEWSDGAVRRFIRRAGPENIDRLFQLRRADLAAHGYVDDKRDLLSELESRVRKMMKGPVAMSDHDLAIGGKAVMETLGLPPGPEVGKVLSMLMENVIDDPALNTEDKLLALIKKTARD